MRYQLLLSDKARHQLRALSKSDRRAAGHRMELLCDSLQGDVKKLEARGNAYRLRVGSLRILFTLEGGRIAVYAVKDRREAYE